MKSAPSSRPTPVDGTPFGANEIRLSGRQWLVTLLLVSMVMILAPRVWERIERYETGPDYRIPYSLSDDYWLYGRRLRQATDASHVIVLGDSVVWGEYVRTDGTLSHFLNQEAGRSNLFINAGVNGFFPLALEGLVKYYGQSLRQQKVVLQCNVLWMTSPKADLSSHKEESFNHTRLVPQFSPRLPCYRADANERLNAVIEREFDFLGWVNHVQNVYFGQKSLPRWTLEDDGGSPPHYPNTWKNPLAQITWIVPTAPSEDPQRGPQSARHKPWSERSGGATRFDWVELERSLQWGAFQRVVEILRGRANQVLVVLGPFNEHMMAPDNRPAYRKIREGIVAWLTENQVPFVAPDPLPSRLYADASHPLTDGYALLATLLYGDGHFQKWLNLPFPP